MNVSSFFRWVGGMTLFMNFNKSHSQHSNTPSEVGSAQCQNKKRNPNFTIQYEYVPKNPHSKTIGLVAVFSAMDIIYHKTTLHSLSQEFSLDQWIISEHWSKQCTLLSTTKVQKTRKRFRICQYANSNFAFEYIACALYEVFILTFGPEWRRVHLYQLP